MPTESVGMSVVSYESPVLIFFVHTEIDVLRFALVLFWCVFKSFSVAISLGMNSFYCLALDLKEC